MQQLRVKKLSIALAFYILFGIFFALLSYLLWRMDGERMTLGQAFARRLPYGLIGAALSPLVLWLARQFPVERGVWLRNCLVHIAASMFVSGLQKFLFDILLAAAYPHKQLSVSSMLVSIGSWLDDGVALYWAILVMNYAFDYYHRYQHGLIEAAQLQTQLVQAQLQALKMQLHPHFLFNTLHTISALVHEDPEAAERTIARLSDLLRISLENTSLQEIPLKQELDFLNLYLDIEKTRFEDRLEVTFEIEPGAEGALVPNLILQPLVENSIRHGLAPRAAGGRLCISAARQRGNLLLMVKDNGCGLPPDHSGRRRGLGLAATRGRLERLYGHAQSLVLRNLRSGGVEACIVMPFAVAPSK
jgi:two-component system LytT family sensor kinase